MANVGTMQPDAFVGISELHILPGGFGNGFSIPQGKTLTEVPVAQDGGFSYNGGEPSIDHYKIHGMNADWTSRMTPGDTDINLFVPVVNDTVLELFGFTTTAVETAVTIAGKAWTGTTIPEVSKAVTVGIAALNDEATKLFGIKAVKLQASILFDSADTAKPIGITLVGSSKAGAAADAMAIFEVSA